MAYGSIIGQTFPQPDLSNYVTNDELNNKNYATESYVNQQIATVGSNYVVGTYIGDGNTSQQINIGFMPSAVMIQKIDRSYPANTQEWYVYEVFAIKGQVARIQLRSQTEIICRITITGFMIWNQSLTESNREVYVYLNNSDALYAYIAFK